jgi:hypothetical protein
MIGSGKIEHIHGLSISLNNFSLFVMHVCFCYLWAGTELGLRQSYVDEGLCHDHLLGGKISCFEI